MRASVTDYQTFDHDVLVIGAGGAGPGPPSPLPRREYPWVWSANRCWARRTVMAEGGVAALGNVDQRDSWQVHFADTMRGGQYVNNWRMAELHAREAPDRVRELEAWGALFDRTDGRDSPAQLRGSQVSPAGSRGRSDRPGDDPHLQDHSIHQGIDVHMECTILRIFTEDGRVAGALAYDREGRSGSFDPRRSCWPPEDRSAYSITSNSWEYTGDGHALAYRAGAALQDMEFVQFHPPA